MSNKKFDPIMDKNQLDELSRERSPSLDYEKDSADLQKAPKISKSLDRSAKTGPIDEPDPEFSDGVKPRLERVQPGHEPTIGKTPKGWQVYVWSPKTKEYIPQGQPHPTAKKAEQDAKGFYMEGCANLKDEDKIISPDEAEEELDEGKPNKDATKEKGGEWAKHLRKGGKKIANKKIRKGGKNITDEVSSFNFTDDEARTNDADEDLQEAKTIKYVVMYEEDRATVMAKSPKEAIKKIAKSHGWPVKDMSAERQDGLDEAKYTFKPKQTITYQNKPWTVKKATKDWVELEDKRGYTTIVDFDDIKTFKGNTVMTEREEQIFNDEMERMNRLIDINELIKITDDEWAKIKPKDKTDGVKTGRGKGIRVKAKSLPKGRLAGRKPDSDGMVLVAIVSDKKGQFMNEAKKLEGKERKEFAKAWNKMDGALVDYMRVINKMFGRSSKEAMELDEGQMIIRSAAIGYLKKSATKGYN